MTHPQSISSREPEPFAQTASGEGAAEAFTFRAPRYGDLVVCPYCDADTFTCDHCGGERRIFASEVFQPGAIQ